MTQAKKTISFKIDETEYQYLKSYAEEQQRSISNCIRIMIKNEIIKGLNDETTK